MAIEWLSTWRARDECAMEIDHGNETDSCLYAIGRHFGDIDIECVCDILLEDYIQLDNGISQLSIKTTQTRYNFCVGYQPTWFTLR